MERPNYPKVGMRVIYGRANQSRLGWKGVITYVDERTHRFEVTWDNYPNDPTEYRALAWSNTEFENRPRNRDTHYIFFDTDNPQNKINFHNMFNCGIELTKDKLTPTIENSNMPKIIEKPILVEGKEIQKLNENELVDLIVVLEAKTKHYESIKVGSTKIKNMIKKVNEAIHETVTELDSRD